MAVGKFEHTQREFTVILELIKFLKGSRGDLEIGIFRLSEKNTQRNVVCQQLLNPRLNPHDRAKIYTENDPSMLSVVLKQILRDHFQVFSAGDLMKLKGGDYTILRDMDLMKKGAFLNLQELVHSFLPSFVHDKTKMTAEGFAVTLAPSLEYSHVQPLGQSPLVIMAQEKERSDFLKTLFEMTPSRLSIAAGTGFLPLDVLPKPVNSSSEAAASPDEEASATSSSPAPESVNKQSMFHPKAPPSQSNSPYSEPKNNP